MYLILFHDVVQWFWGCQCPSSTSLPALKLISPLILQWMSSMNRHKSTMLLLKCFSTTDIVRVHLLTVRVYLIHSMAFINASNRHIYDYGQIHVVGR